MPDATVDAFRVRTCTVSTDLPEANGTAAWTKTSINVVLVPAAGGG